MNLLKHITYINSEVIKRQLNNGSVPPGCNGPYHHPETPVRNTGHWLLLFLKLWGLCGEERYKTAAETCVAYLEKQKRESPYTLYHRTAKNRDKCNGLIGPAWTMEAFIAAGERMERNDLANMAEEIFFLHPFDEQLALWRIREIDGKVKNIDFTFNHQLWFAAISSQLDAKEIRISTLRFLDMLGENLRIASNGRIVHHIPEFFRLRSVQGMRQKLKKIASIGVFFAVRKKEMKNKEIGYHLFNLYAFAILRESFPDHPFWCSETCKKMVGYIETDEFKKGIEDNIYGYGYNAPGFEIPFILYSFADILNLSEQQVIERSEYYLDKQIEKTYNPETRMFDRNTEDPNTLTARIYELCRLPDHILKKITVRLYE